MYVYKNWNGLRKYIQFIDDGVKFKTYIQKFDITKWKKYEEEQWNAIKSFITFNKGLDPTTNFILYSFFNQMGIIEYNKFLTADTEDDEDIYNLRLWDSKFLDDDFYTNFTNMVETILILFNHITLTCLMREIQSQKKFIFESPPFEFEFLC
jgi:hypothetical protein